MPFCFLNRFWPIVYTELWLGSFQFLLLVQPLVLLMEMFSRAEGNIQDIRLKMVMIMTTTTTMTTKIIMMTLRSAKLSNDDYKYAMIFNKIISAKPIV